MCIRQSPLYLFSAHEEGIGPFAFNTYRHFKYSRPKGDEVEESRQRGKDYVPFRYSKLLLCLSSLEAATSLIPIVMIPIMENKTK